MNKNPDTTATASEGPPDFSLVLGGPLYQLLRRAHLSGNVLEMVTRRIVVLSLFAWLPLLALSVVEGNAWGGVKVPFLLDVDVHVRFLLALPLFIVAELLVHQRMHAVIQRFVGRGLVPETAREKFDAAIASALRLRNSAVAELLLIAIVYGVGVLVIWRSRGALDVATWYGMVAGGQMQPTLAGWWFGCVGLPLVQFILLRWYFRLFIWARFLWHVSRIDLNLMPMHPDRAGGLGFLSNVTYAFGPLLAGQGVLLAGLMANRIFFTGARFIDFKVELIAMVTVLVLVVLAPLFVFTPMLLRAKREGLSKYSAFAMRYVREFDRKWLSSGAPPDEPLVGNGDIQSLADLANSYEVIKGMKPVPFSRETVLRLVVIVLLPTAPLLLTAVPFGELIDQFLKIVF